MATELEKLAYCGMPMIRWQGSLKVGHSEGFDENCKRCTERREHMSTGRALGHEEAAKLAFDFDKTDGPTVAAAIRALSKGSD